MYRRGQVIGVGLTLSVTRYALRGMRTVQGCVCLLWGWGITRFPMLCFLLVWGTPGPQALLSPGLGNSRSPSSAFSAFILDQVIQHFQDQRVLPGVALLWCMPGVWRKGCRSGPFIPSSSPRVYSFWGWRLPSVRGSRRRAHSRSGDGLAEPDNL